MEVSRGHDPLKQRVALALLFFVIIFFFLPFVGSPDSTMDSTDFSESLFYKMRAMHRSVFLIINNVDFSQARRNGHVLPDREGSEIDCGKFATQYY